MNVGSTGWSDQKASPQQQPTFRVRPEPFEYGLLPLPTLIFPDPLTSLQAIRGKLLSEDNIGVTISPDGDARIDSTSIATALDLSEEEAQLVVETLVSVLPDSSCPLDTASTIVDGGTVSLNDLTLFLYIQNYKKPPIRPHKDAASVADVWPSTSAFDGFFATLSPLQIRTGKKSIPSQVDEEAHQVAYLQKHLPALVALLAHTLANDEFEAQVLTLEQFSHLGFLLQCGERASEVVPLSQAAPFYANSDPDMPAAPVPLPQVLEWLLEHLSDNRPQERSKENGPEAAEADVAMLDAGVTATAPLDSPRSTLMSGSAQRRGRFQEDLTFVDGITKVSVLKTHNEIHGGSVKVSNCHDSVIYILASMKYTSVYGCSDSIIVLGAVEKVVRIEHCERVQLIVASARVCITNCRECAFYLAVNQRPLIFGENYNLQVAPYNTYYPKLEAHLVQAGIDVSVNKWDKFLTLGVVDPHDPLPRAAGVADAQAEGASLLPPDRFTNFVIPKWNDLDSSHEASTKANPFVLPKAYLVAQQQRVKSIDILRQTVTSAQIDSAKRQDLSQAIQVQFREWLYASGHIRQTYEFQDCDID